MSTDKTVEQTYQKKSQREHILLRPDTYVGSVERETEDMWVLNAHTKRMEKRSITYVPGLYKIFDEILVNAADNKQRDPSMNTLRVTIQAEPPEISVFNNGAGLPVEMHKEHHVYVPELVFGHLLTSSNFDDTQRKTTGGRNGFGAKLTNIFSTLFTVETCDAKRKVRYSQTFRNNMTVTDQPVLSHFEATAEAAARMDSWTKVTFRPDLSKFKMTKLEDDTVALLSKRVYDMAGTSSGVKVFLNHECIPIKSFKQYCALYYSAEGAALAAAASKQKVTKKEKAASLIKTEEGAADTESTTAASAATIATRPPYIFAQLNPRWEIGIGISESNKPEHVSFVNGICTNRGGTHVNYIMEQVCKHIVDILRKKHKALADKIKPQDVKNRLLVFVNCLIENPAFDSQTKGTLTTLKNAFGSTCELEDKFIQRVLRTGIVDHILDSAKGKELKDLQKADGKKTKKSIVGIPKLEDANFAGGKRSDECTLILTEGDSAKALAVSGLSVVGRDLYGVFPLKGKMLNVREATVKQELKNDEIGYLKRILGLQHGKVYEDTRSLRYGHVMIMTDADTDGSHIKGLVINFFAHRYPSLFRMPGFLTEFITPLVKCTAVSAAKGATRKRKNAPSAASSDMTEDGKLQHSFYTLAEYEEWRKRPDNAQEKWVVKYYKGLGTSTAKEAKEYFGNIKKHKIDFKYMGPADEAAMELAFGKKGADQRKDWLKDHWTPELYLPPPIDTHELPFGDFVHKELINFCMASNVRAIPSVIDGQKPGQRKILFTCFSRKLKKEIKVAQLAGSTSEMSAYHHGEASLNQTIVGLAQNFVGSNNINFLVPGGQFGTRLAGGKDAASARYIFTRLDPVTRTIFHPDDDGQLTYLVDDDISIEPQFYVPILPVVLVNGSMGIGSGWSSVLPNYNPRDILNVLHEYVTGSESKAKDMCNAMLPWYRGFQGKIIPFVSSSSTKKTAAKKEDASAAKVEPPKNKSLTSVGIATRNNDTTITIDELPIGTWSTDYAAHLDEMVSEGKIKSFLNHSTDTKPSFTLTLTKENMTAADAAGHVEYLKLRSAKSLSRKYMVLFNKDGKLKQYAQLADILQDFCEVRMDYYTKRKRALLAAMDHQITLLTNKHQFILDVNANKIQLRNCPKQHVIQQLLTLKYVPITSVATDTKPKDTEEDAAADEADTSLQTVTPADGFRYLLEMQIQSLTQERADELAIKLANKRQDRDTLAQTSEKQLWHADLTRFEAALSVHEAEFAAQQESSQKKRKAGTATAARIASGKKKKK